MLIAFRKWARLVNDVTAERKRIEEGACSYVRELAKQILVHLHRRLGIAPDRFLKSGIEGHNICAQMYRRIQAEVEVIVGGISVYDRVGAGN